MTKKLVKLAIIRKNEADPCPFALDIPFGCHQAGDLVTKMSPVNNSAPDAPAIASSNQHLFLWKRPGQRCKFAGKILESDTRAVECNWNSTAPGEEGTPVVGSPWYTKHFSGVGLDGVYTFPLGYYADNSIDRGMYYGMYSIESVASASIISDEDAKLLDSETISEIEEYANNIGVAHFEVEIDAISDAEDIKYWLKNKEKLEGPATDEEIIKQIGGDGKIHRPVIIDVDTDYTVEGRHRLTAAIRYNIPVPVVILSRQ